MRTIVAALLFAALAAAPAARAANCTLSSTGVAFGVYSPLSAAPLDSTGTLTFTCTAGAPAYLILDRGGAASFNPRQMSSTQTPDRMQYNLYRDASHTIIFGDGFFDGTQGMFVNSATGSAQTVVVYGRIPAGQDISVAAYIDLVMATIFF